MPTSNTQIQSYSSLILAESLGYEALQVTVCMIFFQ